MQCRLLASSERHNGGLSIHWSCRKPRSGSDPVAEHRVWSPRPSPGNLSAFRPRAALVAPTQELRCRPLSTRLLQRLRCLAASCHHWYPPPPACLTISALAPPGSSLP